MKEILLRNLNAESKADLREILEEYLSRDYVQTSNGSTAVEQMIREFRRNETRSKSEIEKLQLQIKELRSQVSRLTDQNQTFIAKHKAFANSFQDLLNYSPVGNP